MDRGVVDFFRLGHTLEHQDHGAADGSDVDGFECGVQDEYRLLHDGRFADSGWNSPGRARFGSGIRRGFRPGGIACLARWFHSPRSRSCQPASGAGH